MSKQAKRARQAQRLRGEQPELDRKREASTREYETHKAAVEAAERFKTEYPEEYMKQRLETQRRFRRSMEQMAHLAVIGAALSTRI